MENRKTGAFYALASFLVWGLLPLYWKHLIQFAPLQILTHRILWSFIFLIGFVSFRKRIAEYLSVFVNFKMAMTCLVCAILVSSNWGLYVWAVNSNHLLEASLGYFMTPLLNVLFGVVFLKEKLRKLQWIAVGIAVFSIVLVTTRFNSFPWISVNLAVSFGIYALLRKTMKLDSLMGLAVEVTMMLPIAIGLFLFSSQSGTSWHELQNVSELLWLVGAGVLTSIPLLWFNHGTRRLKLSTIGLLQYLSPSLQFSLAVFVFGENFTLVHRISFGLIWVALIISTVDMLQNERRRASN